MNFQVHMKSGIFISTARMGGANLKNDHKFPFAEIHINSGTLPRRMPADIDPTNKPKIFSPTRTVTGTHKVQAKDMDDLIHLQGPLTEDAVMRTLQARFNDAKYFVSFKFNFQMSRKFEFELFFFRICRPMLDPFSCQSIRIWTLEIH